jgi:hypothetical protein
MPGSKQETATLLDVLIDGFEKNEVIDGFHHRVLPLPDGAVATQRFAVFVAEATRWKGPPTRIDQQDTHQLAAWPELEIRQAGRGIMIRVRRSGFTEWWYDNRTWQDDPLDAVYDNIERESAKDSS